MTRCIISLSLIAGLASPSLADDLTPPPWRFNPGSTVQHWDFSAGAGGGAPDALPLNNSWGTPMLSPSLGSVFQSSFNGRNDVWSLSGQSALQFDIPNTGNSAHQKELWLQVTYFVPAPSPAPTYTVASATTGPFTFISSQVTALPGGWTHELTKWSTLVCPPFERISITPTLVGTVVFVDQVVVDTLCFPVPTPGVAGTLAMGGLVALRRRRN